MLVSAATDVAFWDPGRSDEPIHLSTEHASPVTSLRWTSNDRVLASSSHDGTIHLTESDGRLFDTLRPTVPNEPAAVLPVLSLSWSPGSRYLAAGSSDASVRVFDLQRRIQALQLRGHRASVIATAWNPNEMHVASASTAGEILMHRVQGSVAAVACEVDTMPADLPRSLRAVRNVRATCTSVLRAVRTEGTGQLAPGQAPRYVRRTRTSIGRAVLYVPRTVAP